MILEVKESLFFSEMGIQQAKEAVKAVLRGHKLLYVNELKLFYLQVDFRSEQKLNTSAQHLVKVSNVPLSRDLCRVAPEKLPSKIFVREVVDCFH